MSYKEIGIVVCVTGSVSAYKAVDMARQTTIETWRGLFPSHHPLRKIRWS
jgi:hypothetical protein